MKLDLGLLFQTALGLDNWNKALDNFSKKSLLSKFPSCNIIKVAKKHYKISLALTEFSRKDIKLNLKRLNLKYPEGVI